MSFGEYLKSCRLSSGQTQKDLAEKAGVTIPYISKLERGKEEPPSEETCIKLAAALNEDPYIMIVKAGKMPSDFQQVILNDQDAFNYLKRKSKARLAQGGN
ncbi:helix-turn-helix transcriptional regulator [Neobacillus pocheonensis]|uniref:helix-turn-helix domain-containing protein n=1 Tax=Neobacillus pocheonensis TaxID=363869 RepID=UPI003D2E7513